MICPDHLRGIARDFWIATVEEFNLDDPPALAILGAAAIQLSRAEQARAEVDDDGVTIVDRFGTRKEHPSVGIERQAVNQMRLLLRELGVSQGTDEAARIGRIS